MNSKLIIYLMAGVGVIFMGIVVAYVILSKKLKASDTMQIKQLREGTQEKSFSFEILYQKLYTMYIKNPFTKRYLFKIRRRLEIINIDDEYLTRKQTSTILTRALAMIIPITLVIILITKSNTLLMSILLLFELFMIDTLIDGSFDKIDNKILKAAQSNTIRLNRLIEEILDFQKLENNKLKLNISYGDISSFVCNLCQENFALLAKNKNVSLCMQSEPEHIAAWFDTNKIDKILYNLLSNATKFSYQDGRGKIEILLKAEDQESEFQYKTLLIKIRNIGKGIATDELPYIFNRFYENSFKQLGLKGNGIGLALTKSLVELHKGTISVTSELEEWTEFTIRIPINKTSYSNEQINETIEHRFIVNDSPEGAAIQQSQSNSEIQKSSKQNSVLVIEDDQDLRDSLQRLLQEKYTISMAANGEEGLKLVQEIKPDLILSDVMMPIMDGFELCKQLKRKKETSCIPIILLTAKINDKDYLEGLNCGADAYITKPFNFNVLQANIDMVISNRKRVIDSFKSNPLTQNIDITISSYDEKFLKEAMDIVKKNMENPEFDVKHFCEIMQVSNSMLYRKLKSLANMSPNEFIRSIRLNTAKELIKQRRGNVSDIAYLVGFKDAHYFSVCFKKEFNMTPGEYMETICS